MIDNEEHSPWNIAIFWPNAMARLDPHLDRPQQLNALNWDLINELADAAEAFDNDETLRCIVLTGAGDKAFAAGADIKEMADQTPVTMLTGPFSGWERLRRIHTPMVAAVGGYAFGGGCELAMHCDIIVASENARFGQPEINLGIIPGAGGTQRLARTLGKFVTMEMVLTGRTLRPRNCINSASSTMWSAGNSPGKSQRDRAHHRRSSIAARLAKEAVLAAFETTQEQGLGIEKRLFATLFATEDQKKAWPLSSKSAKAISRAAKFIHQLWR